MDLIKKVETADFAHRLRGYDVEEVDAFHAELIRDIGELQRALAAAPSTRPATDSPVAQAPPRRAAPEPAPREERLYDPDGAVQRMLAIAQRTADEAVSQAKAEGERLVRDAQARADQITAESDQQRTLIVNEAANEARRVAEATRGPLVDEIRRLEDRRDALLADLEALQHHVDAERERLTTAVTRLRDLVADPSGFSVNQAPNSTAEAPPADTAGSAEPVDTAAPSEPAVGLGPADADDDGGYYGLGDAAEMAAAESAAEAGSHYQPDQDDTIATEAPPRGVDSDDPAPEPASATDDVASGVVEPAPAFGDPAPYDDEIDDDVMRFDAGETGQFERIAGGEVAPQEPGGGATGSATVFDMDADDSLDDDPDDGPTASVTDLEAARNEVFRAAHAPLPQPEPTDEPPTPDPVAEPPSLPWDQSDDPEPVAAGGPPTEAVLIDDLLGGDDTNDRFLDELRRATENEFGEDESDAAIAAFFDQDEEDEKNRRRRR